MSIGAVGAADCGAGDGASVAAVVGMMSATTDGAVGVPAAGEADGSTSGICPGSPVGSGVTEGGDGSPVGRTGVSLCVAVGALHAASARIKLPVSRSMRIVHLER